MWVLLLWALLALQKPVAHSAVSKSCVGEAESSSLLQVRKLKSTAALKEQLEAEPEAEPEGEPEGETEATNEANAQFLIQATFGPTRSGMMELAGITQEEWVQRQMELPVESHRAYYRQRVNPVSSSGEEGARGPCDAGSRWSQFVFTLADVEKSVRIVASNSILIDEVPRSDIEVGQLHSRMASVDNFTGFVCSVVPEVGGDVVLSDDCSNRRRRRRKVITVENPVLWNSTGGVATSVGLGFVRSGVVVLEGTPEICSLNEQTLLEVDGEFFQFDSRLHLRSNTLQYPDSEVHNCVPRNSINDRSCRVSQSYFDDLQNNCAVTCGSPGEVENVPAFGHLFPGYLSDNQQQIDQIYDRYSEDPPSTSLARSTVWTMKALEAKDQLRQRTAWALSQIFVASSTSDFMHTEQWLHFYDIFVHNAFGSYLQVMREVAFSPVMGDWLTHRDSSSFEYNEREPNENFAREIMQLFVLGLTKMNPDGSSQLVNGQTVRTYSTKDIMTLSRVFTGFRTRPPRRNVEKGNGENMIDPMDIWPTWHDRHPKADLEGRLFGDLQPLCSETSLTSQGAEYHFVGVTEVSGSLMLAHDSALFGAICGGGVECTNAATVVLNETLSCTGEECDSHVSHVKVGSAFYMYNRAPCVDLFFDPPPVASNDTGIRTTEGECQDESGAGITDGRIQLDSSSETVTEERFASCMAKCQAFGGTGCYVVSGRRRSTRGCFAHTSKSMMQSVGSGRSDARCSSFPTSDWQTGVNYMNSTDDCPDNAGLGFAECEEATGTFPTVSRRRTSRSRRLSPFPAGCSRQGSTVTFEYAPAEAPDNSKRVCRSFVTVDDEGAVVTNGVSFDVAWGVEGPPASGSYTVTVRTAPAFDALPASSDVHDRLRIAAVPPLSDCTVCDGAVKTFSEYGANTVFEVEGRFYRNLESRVMLAGVNNSFRNPPVFMKHAVDGAHERRQAHLEVDALLDHLFRHNNTPVHVAKRLIPRFVTSNPSPAYISAVGDAFRSGMYAGKIYSGSYGDLGATVAAILLHPEARSSGVSAKFFGTLREPMVKIIHVMRAMEYRDAHDEPIVFRQLQDVVGQFPFLAPSVFNFYDAEFELPMQDMSEPEPETESESEAETESESESETEWEPTTPMAPEFQILTPSFFVGYLNTMSSLVKVGVSTKNCGGHAFDVGVSALRSVNGENRETCPQGSFTWAVPETLNETIRELDLLLTGGRLSPAVLGLLREVYQRADPGEKVQSVQQAIMMSTEFNTLGEPLPLGQRATTTAERENGSSNSYKAVVFMYWHGGADTFNLIVPQDCYLYDEYAKMRTDLALSPQELNAITTEGQNCTSFGIHGSFAFLRTLYQRGQAAFVSGVGSLIEPTSVQTYKSGLSQRCFNLFSHNDQYNAALTLKCQNSGTSAKGFGGRMGDALSSGRDMFSTYSWSLAGNNIWPEGVVTKRQVSSDTEQAGFLGYESWRWVIANITGQRHGNVYAEGFATTFLSSMESVESQSASSSEDLPGYSTSTKMKRCLHNVAQLINSHSARGAERELFYVEERGWDMHSNMKSSLSRKFADIDSAVQGFVEEMQRQEQWDNVVLMTESEFGRTLDSNGGGSDHAYAGNHFIVGGALRGGRIFNRYPASVASGSARDLGRGRIVPEFPWESVAVPVATWMGVSSEQLVTTFPNYRNFPSADLIPVEDLFHT